MSGTAAFRVVFVVMPMLGLARPAIGVSLLSALLHRRGHLASTMYLNWAFAERLGYEDYRACGDWHSLPHEALPGEVVFRSALAGPGLPHPFDTGEYAATWALDDEQMARLQRIRRAAEDFVAEMARLPVWDGADLVGFTSSFEQNVASLALARQIKERRPDLPIAFGGANWEGEMGRTLLAEHEFVDFACTGEGDTAFPDLVDALARGEPAPAVAGIAARRGTAAPGSRDLVTDLDSLPPPDYTDYFDTVRASPLRSEVSPVLLVQTARGCWFGERSHCSFCGLNGSTLTFRSKSPERAAREILGLSAAFGVSEVDTVDEIMDMRYLDRMLPVLADRAPADLRLFYEVKANLSHDQVATMRAGRVTNVQPGIESLSDRVLRLMRKGTTTAKNVEFLKWCVEHDVIVYWNLLYGIPGEQLADYAEITRVIRAIRWLPPPTGGAVRLRLDRFSPYHSDPAAFGISDLQPSVAYRHAYGDRPPDVLAGIAYYFTGAYSSHAASPAADALRRSVQHWLADSDRGRLTVRRIDDEALEITDTRPGTGDRVIREYGWRAALLRLLDVGRKWETVQDWCGSRDVAPGDARRLLAEHLRAGTLLRAGGRYVTLTVHTPACPAPAPWPGAGPGRAALPLHTVGVPS